MSGDGGGLDLIGAALILLCQRENCGRHDEVEVHGSDARPMDGHVEVVVPLADGWGFDEARPGEPGDGGAYRLHCPKHRVKDAPADGRLL